MLIDGILSLYIGVVGFFSVLLQRAVNIPAVFLLGVLLVGVLFLERSRREFHIVKYIVLFTFHFFSQLNWIILIYLAFILKDFIQEAKLRKAILPFCLIVGVYEAIRLTYSPLNAYSLLEVFTDSVSAAVLFLMTRYMAGLRAQRQQLHDEKVRLLRHDALTGLINYTEFHRRLEIGLHTHAMMVMLLVDCTNFKAMNQELGFEQGNDILKQVATCLEEAFPDAYLLSRYGGDKFAVVLQGGEVDIALSRFSRVVESDLVNILDTECIYSTAVYPRDADTKDRLISRLEERLFLRKRSLWQQQEEQLLRAEQLKVLGEMAAGMAHEIRNPLTTVKGFLQIAKRNQYNIEPWFPLVMEEIQRMSMLTEEFLSFSKPHTAAFQARPIQQCIRKAHALVESEAVARGHRIAWDQPEEPILAEMDMEKMTQVLLNLLRNALEAMQQPGILTIRLLQVGFEGVIEVADTGAGIPEDAMQKIFLPFYTTKPYGTGLGLYICHKIVHEHHGVMTVTSRLGEGTQFAIRLPLSTPVNELPENPVEIRI